MNRRNYFNNAMYDKAIANITLNGEEMEREIKKRVSFIIAPKQNTQEKFNLESKRSICYKL